MDRLPDLSSLSHAEKDALIHALWAQVQARTAELEARLGLPLGAWVPEQKKRWVARMLGAHVPIITELGQSRPDFGSGCHVSR